MVGGVKCINCGLPAQHMHHVVPKSLGGSDGNNEVPLCAGCHGKIHDLNFLSWKSLQAKGIAKAKARGVYKGRSKSVDRLKVAALRTKGLSTYKIAEEMDVSRMTVHRILNEEGYGKIKVRYKNGQKVELRKDS